MLAPAQTYVSLARSGESARAEPRAHTSCRLACAGQAAAFAQAAHQRRERTAVLASGWLSALALQGALNDSEPLLHHGGDPGGHLIRQQVRDPDEPAVTLAVRKHLSGGIVVRHSTTDHGPHEAPRVIVDIDDYLARDQPVPKGHNPGPFLEPDVCDKSRGQSPMDRADIPKRIPHGRWIRLEPHLTMNGGHNVLAFSSSSALQGHLADRPTRLDTEKGVAAA